ncbi:MAG: hypothetical protein ABJA71_04480 [Ginsengibacter sp.]
MFIGHFAVGFAAKKVNNKPSLGTYFLAAQFLDLLWPTLLLAGVEKVEIIRGKTEGPPINFTYYPFSHSLLMVLVWSLLFYIIYWLAYKNKKAALVLALCVLSHWVLDLFVHLPDLPLYPGNSPLFGFALWKNMTPELIIEFLLFITGVSLYLNSTTATTKTGIFSFWGLIIFLIVIHIANTYSAPPPSVNTIAWAGQLQWLIVLWGYWVDRNRNAN